jgi:hypothetical protein
MRLIDQGIRLIDEVLPLLLIERLHIERGGVERALDLASQRVALRGQTCDLIFD